MPICIVVEAEIVEDRMDEFLDMIEKNAIGSRAEPGCIRFGAYMSSPPFLSPRTDTVSFFASELYLFIDLMH
jgi:quinol monooxygenase YgiN